MSNDASEAYQKMLDAATVIIVEHRISRVFKTTDIA